jgi:hypothetical protein
LAKYKISSETVKKAFAKAGIRPLNPDIVLEKMSGPTHDEDELLEFASRFFASAPPAPAPMVSAVPEQLASEEEQPDAPSSDSESEAEASVETELAPKSRRIKRINLSNQLVTSSEIQQLLIQEREDKKRKLELAEEKRRVRAAKKEKREEEKAQKDQQRQQKKAEKVFIYIY